MANQGLYGYPLPPNVPTRVAPPEWRSFRAFLTAGTYSFNVPQGVYQVLACAMGGGANGTTLRAGAGGGWAQGIIDVVPGQVLPFVVGAAPGGTSSVGSLLTATGASGNTGGAGTTGASLRGAFTANGGDSSSSGAGRGGSSAGSPYGNGGTAFDRGGAGLGANSSGTGGGAAGVGSISSGGGWHECHKSQCLWWPWLVRQRWGAK